MREEHVLQAGQEGEKVPSPREVDRGPLHPILSHQYYGASTVGCEDTNKQTLQRYQATLMTQKFAFTSKLKSSS